MRSIKIFIWGTLLVFLHKNFHSCYYEKRMKDEAENKNLDLELGGERVVIPKLIRSGIYFIDVDDL